MGTMENLMEKMERKMEEELEGLLTAFQICCRGASRNESLVFPKDKAETVIVKVYKDGKTEALCRYLEHGCVAPRCNPERVVSGIGAGKTEDILGICPYCSR